jgi:hypothetical protein
MFKLFLSGQPVDTQQPMNHKIARLLKRKRMEEKIITLMLIVATKFA